MILVGGITDDMNDDDDEVVVVGRTVVGRDVVGVGLSRHFRTPTSSSGQSSSGKIKEFIYSRLSLNEHF